MRRPTTARQLTATLLPDQLIRWGRRVMDHLSFPADFSPEQLALFRRVEPYTMTSPERVAGLINAINYIVDNDLPGDVVECGVWRGGSMMAAALTLNARAKTRRLHLFDTFEGMTAPSSADVAYNGKSAKDLMATSGRKGGRDVWCIADKQDVTQNLSSTQYDMSLVQLVQGRVEETIPHHAPAQISLLRLDTDWYESTKHELLHLYPRLVSGGVLIIDDYGHWQGAKKAVDEYFAELTKKPLLSRLDGTGRIAIKP